MTDQPRQGYAIEFAADGEVTPGDPEESATDTTLDEENNQ